MMLCARPFRPSRVRTSLNIVSGRTFSQSSTRSGSHQLIKNLPHDRSKIYAVIVDVQSYPEFIPYCLSTRIIGPGHTQHKSFEAPSRQLSSQSLKKEEFHVLTRIGYKGFETDYHSRVICEPLESVRVIAQPSATFTNLTTTWGLSDASSPTGSTQVQLDLSFKFKNPIHEFLLTDELIWAKFSSLVIKSFEDRLASLK